MAPERPSAPAPAPAANRRRSSAMTSASASLTMSLPAAGLGLHERAFVRLDEREEQLDRTGVALDGAVHDLLDGRLELAQAPDAAVRLGDRDPLAQRRADDRAQMARPLRPPPRVPRPPGPEPPARRRPPIPHALPIRRAASPACAACPAAPSSFELKIASIKSAPPCQTRSRDVRKDARSRRAMDRVRAAPVNNRRRYRRQLQNSTNPGLWQEKCSEIPSRGRGPARAPGESAPSGRITG